MKKNVTVVITSSDRHDLLERTLDSFMRFNTYDGVRRIVIIEDSPRYPQFVLDAEKYSGYEVHALQNYPRLGQLLSIDIAYKYVTTEYIFHLEDDWEFYAPGFIESSMYILEQSPNILLVHLRKMDNVTMTRSPGAKYAIIEEIHAPAGPWYGFSFNPGLRRLADYRRLGSYTGQLLTPRFQAQHFESFIGELYKEMGYAAAYSLFNEGKGFVRHIGEARHVA